MTMKQREDHVQAKYWNGFITRTEAQKVFDDYAAALGKMTMALQQMDAVVACMASKLDIKPEDVQGWVEAQIAKGEASADGSKDQGQDVSSLTTA